MYNPLECLSASDQQRKINNTWSNAAPLPLPQAPVMNSSSSYPGRRLKVLILLHFSPPSRLRNNRGGCCRVMSTLDPPARALKPSAVLIHLLLALSWIGGRRRGLWGSRRVITSVCGRSEVSRRQRAAGGHNLAAFVCV